MAKIKTYFIETIVKDFKSYKETIPQVLKEAGLAREIKKQDKILLKPNLTTKISFPCTTSTEMVEEVIKFCRENSQAEIVIGEGAGGCDTNEAFEKLGYLDLAKKYNLELLDLNRAPRTEKKNEKAIKLKKVFLPKIAFESYIVNLPVLKVHSEAVMTSAMKNVYGFYLNSSYIGKAAQFLSQSFGSGWWNKSELHFLGVNQTIIDLNNYIKFNFNLVDASVGQLGSEIYGKPCSPPLGKIIAGSEAKKADKVCASILGIDVKKIKYLQD